MKGANELDYQTGRTSNERMIVYSDVERLRLEYVHTIIEALNTPAILGKMDPETRKNLVQTVVAITQLYNEELLKDPDIKKAVDTNNLLNKSRGM